MELQKFFREDYLQELKEKAQSANSFELYLAPSFEIDESRLKRLSGVFAPIGLEEKMSEFGQGDDLKAAITLYEAYENISPLVASSEPFWAYITHTSLFSYSQRRWLSNNAPISENNIIDHWFIGEQGMMRNSAASLWWSVKNSIDLTRPNRYELTEVLFKNYSFRVHAFGQSTIIRHKEATIGILSFLKDNPEITEQNFDNRGRFIVQYFNRLGAVKQLAYLDSNYFYSKCDSLKSNILSIHSREDAKDERLYTDTF